MNNGKNIQNLVLEVKNHICGSFSDVYFIRLMIFCLIFQ